MTMPGTPSASGQAFWAAVREELEALPSEISRRKVDRYSDDSVEVSSMSFTGLGGVGIACWIAAPVGATHGVVVQFPAYATVLFPPTGLAEQGFTGVAVAVRGHHPTDAAVRPGFPGLLVAGLPDPATYIYRGIYADAWRAVQLVGRHVARGLPIAVTGQSQGAALSLFVAARCREVVAVSAEVPFLCAIETALAATRAFPYRELRAYLREHPEQAARVMETLGLFDVMSFAAEVQCPVLMSIGTEDPVTPVEATRALAGALPSAEVIEYRGAGHEGGGMPHRRLQARWLAERLRSAARRDEDGAAS